MSGVRHPSTPQPRVLAGFYGDGRDGDIVIDGEVSFTRDMYFETLTFAPGGRILPGFTVFARSVLVTGHLA
jgi:hypothetical protein